jgi:hypothetical protein
MDTLAKKKEIRQKLQRKLSGQAAEIKRLKRECERKDSDILRLGGVRLERDRHGTRLGIEVIVDDRSSHYYEEIWDRTVAEIGYKLGRAVWGEQAKRAFSDGFRPPHEMEHAKCEWMHEMMSGSSFSRSLNSRELESAWNSALKAITQTHANTRLHPRRLPNLGTMGRGAGHHRHPADAEQEWVHDRG